MRIGVIGGSGIYTLQELAEAEPHVIDTPFGILTSPVREYRYTGHDVGSVGGSRDPLRIFFLPRHGADHSLAPHQINYRANVYALYQLGVERILAINAVGGVNPGLQPGCLVVPDQLIDYSYGREHSYTGTGAVHDMHIDFSVPYDAATRSLLVTAAKVSGVRLVNGGVYACMQGPRLETVAEVARLARDGCDIVGMTGMPEAALARELRLPYASLALVVNKAAGLESEAISMAAMQQVMAAGMLDIQCVLRALFSELWRAG